MEPAKSFAVSLQLASDLSLHSLYCGVQASLWGSTLLHGSLFNTPEEYRLPQETVDTPVDSGFKHDI